MGLYAYAKGLTEKECYDCGYITFGIYRQRVAQAFNNRIGELYKKYYRDNELTEEETDEWNKLCNDDLDIWIVNTFLYNFYKDTFLYSIGVK